MRKYDFENMGGIWKDEARRDHGKRCIYCQFRQLGLVGVFRDGLQYTGYRLRLRGFRLVSCRWFAASSRTDCARYADILGLFRILGSMSIIIFWAVLGSPKLSARSGIQSGSRQQARA